MLTDYYKGMIYQVIGEASMCWNPKPRHQVFDSSKALEIGIETCSKLNDYTNFLIELCLDKNLAMLNIRHEDKEIRELCKRVLKKI
jgi:hypothetical protein